jgi:hypothetical protein
MFLVAQGRVKTNATHVLHSMNEVLGQRQYPSAEIPSRRVEEKPMCPR